MNMATRVTEKWLQGKSEYRANASMSTNGEVLYSYRMIIGRKENGIAYILQSDYSVTTRRHCSNAYWAARRIWGFDRVHMVQPAKVDGWHYFPELTHTPAASYYGGWVDNRTWVNRASAERNLAKLHSIPRNAIAKVVQSRYVNRYHLEYEVFPEFMGTNQAQVSNDYALNGQGIITQNGKFEVKKWYVPVLWDLVTEGNADDTLFGDDTVYSIVNIERNELKHMGENDAYDNNETHVILSEDRQGFVHCWFMNDSDYEAFAESIIY